MIKLVRILVLGAWIGFLTACAGDVTGNKNVEEAREHLAAGKLDAAVIELKNALQKNTDNQEARWLLGELYFNRGAYADAVKELVKARELGKTDEAVLPLLAKSYLAQMDMESLQALSTDRLIGDARAIVLAAKGQGELMSGRAREAADLIREAVVLAPTASYVLLAKAKLQGVESGGDWNSVRTILNDILELDPNYAPALSLLGDIELQGLNSKGAEEAYTKALATDASRLEDRYKRGLVRLQEENLKGAEEDAAYLLQRAPKTPGTQYLNGILLLKQGKIKDAVTALDVARLDENRYPMSLFYLASAHQLLGNPAQAEDYAYRFLAIAPNSVQGRKLLAAMKVASGENDEAEELIRPVFESNNEDTDALNILANVFLNRGEIEEGQTLLAKVAALQPKSPVAQTRLGASLLASGDVVKSFESIEAALELDPNFKQADVLLVSAYLRQGNPEAALKAVDSFEAKNPGSAAPHNLRGEVYLSQKKTIEARESFQRALQIAADDFSANDRLAFLDISEGKYAEARKHYNAILSAQPDHLPTMLKQAALSELQKDAEGMESFLRKAMEAHPKAVEPRVMLARLYLSLGQPEQVTLVLNELDQEGQSQPDVINVIGLSYLNRGDYPNARLAFERLIGLRPEAPQPHHNLGMVFRGLGETEKERLEFEKAIEMAPSFLEPRIELTRMFFRLNDRAGVEDALAALKKLAPEHPEVLQLQAVKAMRDGKPSESLALSKQAFEKARTSRNMLVVAQQLWTLDEKSESLSMMESWLKEHSGDIPVMLEVGAAYVATGEEDKAIKQYEAVLDASPKNVLALNNLGWLLRERDTDQALEYAKQAVDLGQTAQTLDTLAIVLLKSGDTVKAQRTIERALSMAGDDPAIIYHSALIDSQSGASEEAVNKLQKLLSGEKDFPERKDAENLLAELK